jgi:hypothetical protein
MGGGQIGSEGQALGMRFGGTSTRKKKKITWRKRRKARSCPAQELRASVASHSRWGRLGESGVTAPSGTGCAASCLCRWRRWDLLCLAGWHRGLRESRSVCRYERTWTWDSENSTLWHGSCSSRVECLQNWLLIDFYYHIIVVLGVHCDIYKSFYNIS